jgi:hypothetical protein
MSGTTTGGGGNPRHSIQMSRSDGLIAPIAFSDDDALTIAAALQAQGVLPDIAAAIMANLPTP